MKKRRDICAATEAGYTKFEGLSVVIKTECPNSPMFQSKYCNSHSSRVATSTYGGNEEQPTSAMEGVVGVISAKRETGSGVYYQVHLISHFYSSFSIKDCDNSPRLSG